MDYSPTYVYDLTLGIMIWIMFFALSMAVVSWVSAWKIWRKWNEIVPKTL